MVEHEGRYERAATVRCDAGCEPRADLLDPGTATVRPTTVKLLATLPARVPRDDAASLVTRHFFRVSSRTLERWPVVVTLVNGRAHIETGELFRMAQTMLDRAPRVRGGRRKPTPSERHLDSC
jgi:hypothetical protein